jgi:L-ribulose-5-phosphate 3-epimerase
MNRRTFLGSIAAPALTGMVSGPYLVAQEKNEPAPSTKPVVPWSERICLFTDHLDDFGYSYADVARMLKQLRIAGPDLTVRPGGLVLPERVTEDLPKAAAIFRDHGLSIPMISTALTSARDRTAAATFTAANKLGIRYFKLGYYRYDDVADWRTSLDNTRAQLKSLLELSGKAGMVAGFHNHSGPYIGGALWDSWELLSNLDPNRVGFYFDPAQATIEGGNHAWKLGLTRLAPRLVMVAIKDFVWEKDGRQWRTRWVPLGEGMVRWDEVFGLLAKSPFAGPISLHIEYDPGGTTKAARFENSLAAAERDLRFLLMQLSPAPKRQATGDT